MDPQNTQTQVDEVTQTLDVPPQPTPAPLETTTTNMVQTPFSSTTTVSQQPVPQVVPPPVATSLVETPPVENPNKSSVLMKVAIGILVVALLVALSYVVYANFISPANQTPTTELFVETPTMLPSATEIPVEPSPASESASPVESPTVVPTATPL